MVYKDVKDNIFITGDSCHSDSYTEGNLYPVKYLEGKKQLVATWENVNTMFWRNYLGTENPISRYIPIKDIDKFIKSIKPVFSDSREEAVNSGIYLRTFYSAKTTGYF